MKGIFKILSVMFFFVLLFAFGIRCYAEGEGRYIITSDDLGFHAYRDGEADKPPTITDESLGDLLRQLKPSYVYFSNITSDSFTFPDGDITVSGGITLSENSVITISKESNINFANISITAPTNSENAIIRIKGGSLEINGSNISGGRGGCISLDYSATSTLTVNDGVVSSSSDGASIHVLQGTANICGGRISNAIGAGVMNFGSLAVGKGSIVCGNMYDIVTNKPISVIQSCSGDFPRLRIQYESIFSKGSLTEILYSA